MFKNRQFIAIAMISIFGFLLFYIGTDGFQAFTAETARTNQLISDQPQMPEVTLEDSKGREYDFSEFDGQYLMMTYIYTRCTTVCPQLEKNLAEVYEVIPEKHLGENITFLSVSFDPERDTPEVLDRYRTYFGSDGEKWRMARIPDQKQLDYLLDEIEVIVIPDGEGDFAHNVAFYLVDPDGYLVDVMDFTDIEGAQNQLLDILQEMEG